MSNLNTQSCRLCGRSYPDTHDLIGIFSDEGQRLQIAEKILFSSSIMTTENDPTPKYVCKVCFGHLECNFKFTWACRTKNYDIVQNAMKLPHQNTYCEELKKFLKVPFQSLYLKSSARITDVYETVANHLKNPESNSKTFARYLDHKVLNIFEKKKPASNGFIQIPPVPLINRFQTSLTNSYNVGNGSTNIIPRITILNRNTIVSNGPIMSNSTNHDHNYNDTQSRVNETNATENDEVICVDDDDDNNDLQLVENTVNPLGTWVFNNNNNVQKSKVSKSQVNNTLQKEFQFQRKLISISDLSNFPNSSSNITTRLHSSVSNVASEDVTITPDMPLLNIDEMSSSNLTENNFYEESSHVTSDPPLFTPETGIHFLFEPETVDLTTTESPKKKPGRKRKIKSDVKKSSPAKKTCQKNPIVVENEAENNQLQSESSPETAVNLSMSAEKKTICQKTPIASENEKENNNLQPKTLPETIVNPSMLTEKKKICRKVSFASEIGEENNHLTPESPLVVLDKLNIIPEKKRICRKTPIVPENKVKYNRLTRESSLNVVAKTSIVAEKKKICRKAPDNKKKYNQSTPESSLKVFAKPRLLTEKKSVTPVPKRFSKRLLYKPLPKPSGPKQVLNEEPSSINKLNLSKYSKLLGKQVNGSWEVNTSRLELSLYKCPICDCIFHSIKSRQNHENNTHFLPKNFPPPSNESVKKSENTFTEQQAFLLNLNLIKKIPLKQNTMDILASRPHLLRSLRLVGNTNDVYNCQNCEYETSRLFILWAHITSNHFEPIVEKRSNPFCFLCNRSLNKRIQFLKHVEQCINRVSREETTSEPPVESFSCYLCDDNFNSSSDLEKHFYMHVAVARKNKTNN